MTVKPVSFSRPLTSEPRLSRPYVRGKHDLRFWTEAEHEVIKTYFPAGGAAACLAHLPKHRTPSGVYQQAKKLGVTSSASSPHKGRHESSPELDERIRNEWKQLDGRKRGEVAALADRLGVPRWWLTKRATTLGITMPHKKEPPWTNAEKALMAKVPLHKPDEAARIFRENGFSRSPTAIVVMAKRLDLSRRATREELSATLASKILGVDSKFITARILSGDLQATKREDKRLNQQGGSSWDIRPADLKAFILGNLEFIDLRKVDKFEFVHLISQQFGEIQP